MCGLIDFAWTLSWSNKPLHIKNDKDGVIKISSISEDILICIYY